MTQMTDNARALAISAYEAGEMNFEIHATAANLAAAHVHNPDPVIMAGKTFLDAALADAEERDHLTEWQFEDLEYLVDLYEDYVQEYVPAADYVITDGWGASTADTLVAVYLLINKQVENMAVPYGGNETTNLVGNLGTHIEGLIGGLGDRDPHDMVDELTANA